MCLNRVRACTWYDRSGNPLFFTSHSITRQGKRSERIHSFLAKVHRFLYVHVDFLALRTFKQAANFEVALCPNYLIILLIITSTSSSLPHQSLNLFFLIGTRSAMKDFHYFPRTLSSLFRHIRRRSNGPLTLKLRMHT